MGNVLKQSSAASSGAGSATWGQYADYYAALGFHASAREALLKQVRLLFGVLSPLCCWPVQCRRQQASSESSP